MPRLIHTGSVIIDQVMTVPHLPEPGGDVVASSSSLMVGGGFNTIVAAVRDGLPVVYAGLLGTGDYAKKVREALAQYDVQIAHRPVPDMDTGFCIAIVDGLAERTFFTHVGAEGLEGYEELASIALLPDDVIYVTGYSLASKRNSDGLIRWLPEIPEENLVFIDPSPLVGDLEEHQIEPLLKHADILSANARETRILGGDKNLDRARQTLRRRLRSDAVLISRDGKNGTWVSKNSQDKGVVVPAPVVQAVDSNGAGDAHAGVMLAALGRGESLLDAVWRANVAAAIAVTEEGPATSPTAAQIEAMMSQLEQGAAR